MTRRRHVSRRRVSPAARRAARRDYWTSAPAARVSRDLDRAARRLRPALHWSAAIGGAAALMTLGSLNF